MRARSKRWREREKERESEIERRLQSCLIYLIASPGLQPGFNASPSGRLAWKQKEEAVEAPGGGGRGGRKKERKELLLLPRYFLFSSSSSFSSSFVGIAPVLEWNSLRIIFTCTSGVVVQPFRSLCPTPLIISLSCPSAVRHALLWILWVFFPNAKQNQLHAKSYDLR